MLLSWLYSLIYPLLRLSLLVFGRLHPKVRQGLKLRQSRQGQKPWLAQPEDTGPYWFHCSSGEFEYAKPVIRELKKQNPKAKILVTYFSPSVEKSLKGTSEVDFFTPTPWDSKAEWQKFIEHHKPLSLMVARTDLWPHMIKVARKNKLPMLLFSKTEKKHKGFWQKHLESHLLKYFTDVFCVSEEDKDRLYQRIKPYKNIHNAGDTRYDQCLYRLQNGKPLTPLNNFNKPIMVAGSTWPSDERVLLDTISSTIKDYSFVVAPHEPTATHLLSIEKELSQKGIETQRYSQIQSWDPQAVLLIDQVGILADLYAWGQYAFVGGSMDRSVHSVMEPLAQGLLTFVGPEHENNREATNFKQIQVEDMTPVQVIKDSDEMCRRFLTLAPSWSENHRLHLRQTIRQKSGASAIVVKWAGNNKKDWT